MKIRVVQIWGFLMTVLGWVFVACTMAMEGWKIAPIGGMGGSSIMKVAWHWSSLWKKCFTDSTSVTNCYDFPVLWSVDGYVQIVRGLLMGALSLGMLGFILGMLGMECTHIGGKDPSKYKKIFMGGLCHIISGALSTCGYAVYSEYIIIKNFDSNLTGLEYRLGTPMFLGWVGSAFHMMGGFFYLWSVCTPLCGRGERVITVKPQPDLETNKPTTASSAISEVTSNTTLSSISVLSSQSERSDVSSSSKSAHTSKSGGTARSGRTPRSNGTSEYGSGSRSGSEFQSGLSLESSLSTLSESRSSSRSSRSSGSSQSSRTVSSLSDSSRSGATLFAKKAYI